MAVWQRMCLVLTSAALLCGPAQVQADADVTALQKRIAELEARDTERTSHLASLEAKLKSATVSHTQSQSEMEALEARLKEADAMRGKDEGLHAKIASLNEKLKKADAAAAGTCSAETSKLKKQVDAVAKEAKEHQAKHLSLEKKLEMTHALLHAAHSQWLPTWTNPYSEQAWKIALPAITFFHREVTSGKLYGTVKRYGALAMDKIHPHVKSASAAAHPHLAIARAKFAEVYAKAEKELSKEQYASVRTTWALAKKHTLGMYHTVSKHASTAAAHPTVVKTQETVKGHAMRTESDVNRIAHGLLERAFPGIMSTPDSVQNLRTTIQGLALGFPLLLLGYFWPRRRTTAPVVATKPRKPVKKTR